MDKKSCTDCYETDLMKCAACARNTKGVEIDPVKKDMTNIKEKLVELIRETPYIHWNASKLPHVMADHLIANGVTIQQWISVEEGLPEMSGEYLTISTNGVTAVLPYSNKYNAFNASDDFYKASCVIPCTHWALMPEPPKAK